MKYVELKDFISSGNIDETLIKIYCTNDLTDIKQRYLSLLDEAYNLYGDGDYHFISSPGRSEIGGNHTDHQHGHVLAASLNIDNLAIVKPNNSKYINYKDRDFGVKQIDIEDLELKKEEYNTSQSLIKGIAFRLKQLGYQIGGFDGLCDSKVLVGSGISSSACFEVLICEIFNSLFNEDKISAIERAIVSQYAENVYFGKPSGLMDQMSISVGGFVAIDFKDPDNPIIENYDFSFSDYDYELLLIDTKGDHSDLSDEYAAITQEIKMVANGLGVEYLADSNKDTLLNNFSKLRNEIKNDRALLRAIHFYNEDDRAIKQKKAIQNKDIDSLLSLMNDSAKSSFEYLQNIHSTNNVASQSLAIGLALADTYLKGDGVARVHGGGFEGTIQVIVKKQDLSGLQSLMKANFGDDCLLEVKIRPVGTITVI